MRWVALAGLLAVCAPACIVDINFGDGAYRCGMEPMECQDGFECQAGVCVSMAAADAGVDPDGPAPIAPMLPSYGAPVFISELNDPLAADDDPGFTASRLYVVFSSDRGGDDSLMESSRPSVDEPWETPTLIAELATPQREAGVAIAPDGLTLFFASDRPGGLGGLDIYESRRASLGVAWGPPAIVSELSSTADELPGSISADGTTIVLNSNRDGSQDLFTAERSGGVFGAPQPIAELNTADSNENTGSFAADGLIFIFHSNRPGGLGRADVYVATRARTSDPFGAPMLIPGINSANGEQDASLTDDLCTLTFVRSGDDGFQNIGEALCEQN